MSDIELKGVVPDTVYISVKDKLRIGKDLDLELDEASEQFGYYGVLAERADTAYQRSELAYKIWRAEVEKKKNQELKISGEKMTKDQMIAHIRGLEEYSLRKLRLIDLDEKKRILKVLAKAFDKKSELIRTKCSNKRKETR